MSLNANWTAVRDHETLHADPAEYAKTESIVFWTMAVGIGKITPATVGTFATRLRAWQRVEGGPRSNAITRADVERRIGLYTNVAFETHAAFARRIAAAILQLATDDVARERDAAKKAS